MNECLASAIAGLAATLGACGVAFLTWLAFEIWWRASGPPVATPQPKHGRAAGAEAAVRCLPPVEPDPVEVVRLHEMELAAMQRLDQIQRDAEARLARVRR
jgi:hypothetical protein